MIRTVLGDILSEQLGVTMCHEHLSMDLSHVRGDADSKFTDSTQILPELLKLVALGVNSVVEVSTIDMRRDIQAIRQYAIDSKLQIIAATGFYLQVYHPKYLATTDIDSIAALFRKELTEGIDETNICAGIIGEVASSCNRMTLEEEKVFIAAALAAKDIGCAVSTHCDMGTLGLEQTLLLKKCGMNPEKIIIGHLDLLDDSEYHMRVLEEGVNIAFDTIGKISYLSDEKRADMLVYLLEQGFEDQIVLSQDVSRLSYMTASGGLGYTAVMSNFIPHLYTRGVSTQQIRKLLVENPARILELG